MAKIQLAPVWLGLRTYNDGLAWQETAHASVVNAAAAVTAGTATAAGAATGTAGSGAADAVTVPIAGLTHADVITLGTRGRIKADVCETEERLRQMQVDVVVTERGGHATLHTPGQLVIYPILPLRYLGIGVRAYVELLERTTQAWLETLGVATRKQGCEPGLYTARGKLAFFGVRIKNGVSLHGVSINVSNDLAKFAWIRSCGKDVERFDRLFDHGCMWSLESLFDLWGQTFAANLHELFKNKNKNSDIQNAALDESPV